jgi:WD40 repeat protein
VKSPRLEVLASADGRELFVEEAEIWVGLGLHPHVCCCHYVRTLGGIPRVFAEWVDGGSLADWIWDGRLYAGDEVLARVLDIAVQTAWAIAHAHAGGMVHQDVKPGNVLLEGTGVAKLTDFGLARAGTVGTKDAGVPGGTVLATVGGLTPAFASPEQASGSRVGRRSDVWSWAVSVLQMFTREVVWVSGPYAGRALATLGETVLPLPAPVANLLAWCLRDDPDERPRGMAEVVDNLVALYHAELGRPYPRPAPRLADLRGDELKNRALSLLDLGQDDAAEQCWRQALDVVAHHPDATFNLGLHRWRAGRGTDQDLVDDLEQARIARSAEDGRVEHLLGLAHLERGDTVTAADQLERAAGFSPTDRAVLAALEHAEPSAEQPAAFALADPNKIWAFAVSADGRLVADVDTDGEIRCWDAATGTHLRTISTRAGANHVAVTPDGHYLAASGNEQLHWWDFATGQHLATVRSGTVEALAAASTADGPLVAAQTRNAVDFWRIGARRPVSYPHATSVAVTPDGRYAVTGSRKGTAQWWDLRGGVCLRTFTAMGELRAVAVTPDGQRALICPLGAAPEWWDLRGERRLGTLAGHQDLIEDVALAPDGRHAITVGNSRTVRWWDLAAGRCLRTFPSPGDYVTAVAFTPDQRHAVVAGPPARLLRLDTGRAAPWSYSRPHGVADLSRHEADFRMHLDNARRLADRGIPSEALASLRAARAVPGFQLHPDLVTLWRTLGEGGRRTRLQRAEELRVLPDEPDGGVTLHPTLTADGTRGLFVGPHKTLEFRELASMSCLHRLGTEPSFTDDYAITPDGTVAVASDGHLVRWWDLTSGQERGTLAGHT